MRVLGISGSPRHNGNTDIMVHTALDLLAGQGLQTEFLSLADRPVKPCVGCRGCFAAATMRCVRTTRPSRACWMPLPRPTAF